MEAIPNFILKNCSLPLFYEKQRQEALRVVREELAACGRPDLLEDVEASLPTDGDAFIEKSWELTLGKRPARTDPGNEDPLERALSEVATQAKSHLQGRVNKTLARARQTHVLELARTGGESEAHTETRMLAGLGTGSRALTALPTCGATTFDNWSLRSFCTQRLNIPPSALGHIICRHCTPIDPRDNAFRSEQDSTSHALSCPKMKDHATHCHHRVVRDLIRVISSLGISARLGGRKTSFTGGGKEQYVIPDAEFGEGFLWIDVGIVVTTCPSNIGNDAIMQQVQRGKTSQVRQGGDTLCRG